MQIINDKEISKMTLAEVMRKLETLKGQLVFIDEKKLTEIYPGNQNSKFAEMLKLRRESLEVDVKKAEARCARLTKRYSRIETEITANQKAIDDNRVILSYCEQAQAGNLSVATHLLSMMGTSGLFGEFVPELGDKQIAAITKKTEKLERRNAQLQAKLQAI